MIQKYERVSHIFVKIGSIGILTILLLIATLPTGCLAETWPYCTPREGAVPFTVEFVVPDPVAVTGVLWEFGDTETSSKAKTSHTYTKPTIYYPKLTLYIPGGDIVYDFTYLKAMMSEDSRSSKNEMMYPKDYTIYTETDQIATFSASDYTARGESLRRLGFTKEAADAFKSAINMDSGHTNAWKGYASTQYSRGLYADAVSAYQKVMVLDPSDTSILEFYGHALIAVHKYDEAVRIFEEATKYSGNQGSVWSGYGEALLAAGMKTEAVSALERATSIDSGDARAWLNYGKILADEGRFDEAKSKLEKSLAINGGSTVAWSTYANVLQSLGYDEDASKARRKAGSMNTVTLPKRAPVPQYCSF